MKKQIIVGKYANAAELKAAQDGARKARRKAILARRVPRGNRLMRTSVRTARKALTAFHVEANRIAQVICDVQGGRIWPEGAPWAMGTKSKIVKLSSTAEDAARIAELLNARKAVCVGEDISLSGLVRGPTSTPPRATRAHCAWKIPDLTLGRDEAAVRAMCGERWADGKRVTLPFRESVAAGRARKNGQTYLADEAASVRSASEAGQ